MTFELYELFSFVEVDYFGVSLLFIKNGENANLLIGGQTHDSLRVFGSHVIIRAIQVLEIIDVDFMFKYNDNLVFSQFYIQDISFEVEFTKWPVLNIVPKNKSLRWVTVIISGSYQCDYISSKKHFCHLHTALEI